MLTARGFDFDVLPTATSELLHSDDPTSLARHNAELKVRESACFGDGSRLLLGADTVIDLDGQCLGKPQDQMDAAGMLVRLSGREHRVITALTLSGPSPSASHSPLLVTAHAISTVEFRALSQTDIDHYILSQEWQGKAGAYAIQGLGADLVSRLQGDLHNVIGLPTALLDELLLRHFSHCRLL